MADSTNTQLFLSPLLLSTSGNVPTSSVSNAFIKFTPISGVYRDGNVPFCYLLEIDNTKILLDAGIHPDTYAVDHLSVFEHLTPDVILISHLGVEYAGGIPYLVQKYNLKCPIYATTPVHHLASLSLYEAAQGYSQGHLPEYLEPSLVERVFNPPQSQAASGFITQVRYFQPIGLSGGITFMAVPSGHSPGGTIWRIRKHGEDIFYVLRMNHRKEATLDGAMLNLIHRPTLLIMDAFPALKPESSPIKDRNSQLIESIQACLKAGGSVLIPTQYDRLIELVYVLKQLTPPPSLLSSSFKIYLCGYQANTFLDLLKGFIEWMGTALMREFEKIHGNPFKFDNLSVVSHPSDLERLLSTSQKIFISVGSFEHGFTKLLVQKFVSDKNNLIVFPQEPSATSTDASSTLAHSLYTGSSLTLTIYEKELLEGEDLRRWKAAKKEQEQQAAAEEAFAALQKRRANITEELAAAEEDVDELETEPEDEIFEPQAMAIPIISNKQKADKKDDLLLAEDIQSAQMLKEIYWSDYKNDWYLDLQKDTAMRSWVEDPEGASLSILGGITPGHRYQVFPVASGIISSSSSSTIANSSSNIAIGNKALYPPKIVNSPYGILLDFATLYPDHFHYIAHQQQSEPLSLSTPQMQNLLSSSVRRVPLIPRDDRPHRFVPKEIKLPIRCQRKYYDWSGLTDGKSLRIFLAKMSPRRTILIGAGQEATEFLYNHMVLSNPVVGSSEVSVVAPSRNFECVNVTQSQVLLPAVISDDLAASCRVVHYNGFELGKMQFLSKNSIEPQSPDNNELPIDRENHKILNKPTSSPRTTSLLNGLLMIGDLKLPHIKRSLNDASLVLEFISGDLVVSSVPASGGAGKKIATIRKLDEGSIMLEGEVCAEFFKIRQFLYSQLAVITS